MEALFRLLEIRDGIAHVAEVGIRAETADRDEILLSTSMFVWRREAYGPSAVMQLDSDTALVREAIDGVQDGLERVSRDHGGGYRVTVTKIWESVIDTSPGDVRVGEISVAIGAPAITFHNWPDLTQPFLTELPGMLGGRTMTARAHL